jgi:hypothetical protein
MVILPGLGALCAAFIVQFRLHDQLRLFTEVSNSFGDLLARGKARLSECKDDPAYTKLHRDLAAEAVKLFREHQKSYYGMFSPEFVASLEKKACGGVALADDKC